MNYKMSYRNGKTDREHRFIAEEMLGRKLRADEIVHHKDGNKRNNSKDNLAIMTRAEHSKEHKDVLDKSIPVRQMSKDGMIIRVWESAKEAAQENDSYAGNISKCCHGKLKTTGGYMWSFANV